MRGESGAITGIIGVSQDLSGRKRTEEDLRSERAELEKRVQERTAELDAANQSLRELSARLLQTRDQEARRLARELHDSAGQLLAAISMNIAKVKAQAHKLDEAGARAVTENIEMVEQISSEIRTISHLLHPPLLDELGLASALRWYVEGFSERSKITVEVEIPPDLGALAHGTGNCDFPYRAGMLDEYSPARGQQDGGDPYTARRGAGCGDGGRFRERHSHGETASEHVGRGIPGNVRTDPLFGREAGIAIGQQWDRGDSDIAVGAGERGGGAGRGEWGEV